MDALLAAPAPLARFGLQPNQPFLLFVGKLDPSKGAGLLPAALAAAGVGAGLPVVFAGSGALQRWLEAQGQARGLDFRFGDWLDNADALRLMKRATVLLFPSAWDEPLTRVLLEGCAVGATILALHTGGTADIIEDGVNGRLVGDMGAFAERPTRPARPSAGAGATGRGRAGDRRAPLQRRRRAWPAWKRCTPDRSYASQRAPGTRAIFPQHGYGGMERAATALHTGMLEAGLDVTLLTRRPPEPAPEWRVEWREEAFGPHALPGKVIGVPYQPAAAAAQLGRRPAQQLPAVRRPHGRDAEPGAPRGAGHRLRARAVRLRRAPARAPARPRGRGAAGDEPARPGGFQGYATRASGSAYAPFRAMYMRGAQAADRVIATDESLRGEVARFLRVPARRICVIPNGVDPAIGAALVSSARQAALRARLALPDGVFVGLTVARLEANKGLPDLLRALAALDPALEWRWIIVGAGRDRAPLEALARRLGVAARARFVGSVGEVDLHNLYALAGGFALPSLYEGSSLATLEAMAHGLPVVATRVGGLPDKVRPGETGLLVPPGDAPALSAALARLMSDADAAAAMGRAGAALVEARFTWAAITAQTIALFEELKPSSR